MEFLIFRYKRLLTPFIYKKIELELKLREKVLIVNKRQNTYTTQSGYEVTNDYCTCPFFITMKLPCKHIFKLLENQDTSLYVPALCNERWTKAYYYSSSPALSGYGEIQQPKPIHVHAVRVPSEIDKFKKMNTLSKEICNMGASMANGKYQYFMDKMNRLRNEMADRNNVTNENDEPEPDPSIVVSSSSASTPRNVPSVSSTRNLMLSVDSTEKNPPSVSTTNSFSHPIASTSSSNVNEEANEHAAKDYVPYMKLPSKLPTIGRPKGSGQTVIGTKRKPNNKTIDGPTPPKKKFLDLDVDEQSLTVIQWLTNKSETDIQKKKVTYSDIIQDPLMFNRLRNDGIDWDGLKKIVDKKCYKYLSDEIERLNETNYWACAKCKRNLSQGTHLMCNKCLDWFHLNCTEYKSGKLSKNLIYFCASCK